jgi:hypothetical protein
VVGQDNNVSDGKWVMYAQLWLKSMFCRQEAGNVVIGREAYVDANWQDDSVQMLCIKMYWVA